MALVAVNQTSLIDPIHEALVWSRSINASRGFIYLFGGTEQHIQALLEKAPDTTHLFVLEPDRYFKFEHPRVWVSHTMDELGLNFPTLEIRQKGFTVASIPSYRLLYPVLYKRWAEWLEKMSSATAVDVVTSFRFSREWQRNTIENMVWLKKSAAASGLFGKWQNKPFIIVSAGPSLDNALDDLRLLQGKAFIVAAGTTAPVLQKAGIKPSLYIAFDAGLANWRGHFRGLGLTVPLLYDLMLHPFVMKDHFGPKMAMQIWPFEYLAQVLEYDIGVVEVGPSVANTAMRLAIKMGADPVILVGQDLGFTGGRYHANGTHQTVDKVPLPDMRAHIPAVGGGTIETTLTMQTFWWNFNEIVSQFSRRYINTSFGAKITGTEDMPLEQVRRQLLVNDLSADLAAISYEPAKFNLRNLAEKLQRCVEACIDLLKHMELTVLSETLNSGPFGPLAFILNPIWSDSRCDDIDWGYKRTREELRWVIPVLQKTIKGLA